MCKSTQLVVAIELLSILAGWSLQVRKTYYQVPPASFWVTQNFGGFKEQGPKLPGWKRVTSMQGWSIRVTWKKLVLIFRYFASIYLFMYLCVSFWLMIYLYNTSTLFHVISSWIIQQTGKSRIVHQPWFPGNKDHILSIETACHGFIMTSRYKLRPWEKELSFFLSSHDIMVQKNRWNKATSIVLCPSLEQKWLQNNVPRNWNEETETSNLRWWSRNGTMGKRLEWDFNKNWYLDGQMLGSPDVIGLLGFEHWMSQNEKVTETRRGFILFPKNPGMSFGWDYYQDGIGTRKILL